MSQISNIYEVKIPKKLSAILGLDIERIKNLNEDRRITIDRRDYQALENSYCIVLLVIK